MSNNKNYEMSNSEIEELTKLPVIANIPHDRNVHKSLTLKMPVVMYKPYSAGRQALEKAQTEKIGLNPFGK